MTTKNMAVLDENNVVVNIVVVHEDTPETPTLIEYNDNDPAYIGGDYFEGKFYPPKPYPSWIRGTYRISQHNLDTKHGWVAPKPIPDIPEEHEGIERVWDETKKDWKILNQFLLNFKMI